MISFENVTKKYHYEQYPTLENVSFCAKSPVTTLLMETQSGKTTVAKLIIGAEQPTSGAIYLGERPLSELPLSEREIAYFPQMPFFFEQKSVAANLAYPLKIRKTPKAELAKIIAETAQRFSLDTDKKVKTLSRDEKIRLAVARASQRKVTLALIDDLPELYDYLSVFQNASVFCLTSKLKNAIGEIITIKDNKTVYTRTKEASLEYIKQVVWLDGSEFSEKE